jgi:hypothetical protein
MADAKRRPCIARRAKAPEPDKCSPFSRPGQLERVKEAGRRGAVGRRIDRRLLEALGPVDDLEGYV